MSKKLIVILAVLGVLILGMMGAGFFVIWNKVANMSPAGAVAASETEAEDAVEGEEEVPPIGATYPLATFIVNLAEKDGNRYLRVTMELELSEETLRAELDQRLPQVRDALLMILPTKKIEDISTVEGKSALRDEVIVALNEFLNTGEITDLYFTEFVIQ